MILDPASGFAEHATGASNDPDGTLGQMAQAFAQFVAMALEWGEDKDEHDTERIMASVGPAKFGSAPHALTFPSIADHPHLDDPRNDVSESEFAGHKHKPKTEKILELQVLQEMVRCLPFLSFENFGGPLIDRGMLQHGAAELSITMAAAVQRVIRRQPENRPEIVLAIVDRLVLTSPATSQLTRAGTSWPWPSPSSS